MRWLENLAWFLLALLADGTEGCLCPDVYFLWLNGNDMEGTKKGLVKLRTCGKVKAVRDGGGQQNSVKAITSHCLLKIVLNQ